MVVATRRKRLPSPDEHDDSSLMISISLLNAPTVEKVTRGPQYDPSDLRGRRGDKSQRAEDTDRSWRIADFEFRITESRPQEMVRSN